MKKTIALILVTLSIICIFTACKKEDSSQLPEDIKVIDFDTTRPTEETTEIKTNKTYKINIPYDHVEIDAEGDIKKYAETYGFDVKEEKDGTVTMKMDGMTYSLFLSRIGMKVMVGLGELVDSGYYPYVVKLGDYNEDFSYILMLVNNDKYEKADGKPSYKDLASFIGQLGLYYQNFTLEEEDKCEVVIAGYKSGKILHREVFTD